MNVRKFTEASMLSAAFVALSVLCISIGLGYFGYIDFIVPAFAGIILLKCDLKYTILSCISSLILIIFVIGDLPSGIMMSQSMILGIIITYFIKKDESIFDDLFFSSIAACAVMIFIDINFSALTGYSFLKESKDYLNMLPAIYEPYKDIILYMSVACLPIGTVIIAYIGTVVLAKRFKIDNEAALKKSNIIRHFKRYGQFLSCTRKTIYSGIVCIISVLFINKYILSDKYSYIAILLNSIMYVMLFFILQDSFSVINKCVYGITKTRFKLFICQFALLYFLIGAFKITALIMTLLNLYLDYKFQLKYKYKQILKNNILEKES
ncbi:DUF2232 domain-containing protein [uncultured Clostridium sp.]|uniref:DUF2232 domain-containing protein n=1 Tax=uncultured Clostridium sp. TaxID=59620 RepID=UPI0025D5A858|nr:DUF2232 domain-containing protein [uncultured Clostridium sp.]